MSGRAFATATRWTTALLMAGMGLAGSASATLINHDPNFGPLLYDDVLNITWTRQAGDGVFRNWADSVAWADNLVFAGFDDWRLPWGSVLAGAGPTTSVYACTGAGGADEVACRDNEMGYMFYYNLGGTLGQDKTGNQQPVDVPPQVGFLTGIQRFYWSGTEFDSVFAWDFPFINGSLDHEPKVFSFWAWAVRPGDYVAAAAPEPASLLLVGVGMLGLAWWRRSGRRR